MPLGAAATLTLPKLSGLDSTMPDLPAFVVSNTYAQLLRASPHQCQRSGQIVAAGALPEVPQASGGQLVASPYAWMATETSLNAGA